MSFSVNGFVLVVTVVFVTSILHTHTTTSLVKASLLVTEPASSSNDSNADKEIAFISVNGNHLNDSKPKATTQNAVINAKTVSTTRSTPARLLKRGKRYLDFLNTSRMFVGGDWHSFFFQTTLMYTFIRKIKFRVNGKNSIVPKPTIWFYGYGFRCNFPIENDKRVRPFRRDTYETLGDLMDKSGFDGKACILKAFCAAHLDETADGNQGILFKLFKYIFTLNDDDKRHFPYLRHENCHQILHSHCPLSFNNISPFTDDV